MIPVVLALATTECVYRGHYKYQNSSDPYNPRSALPFYYFTNVTNNLNVQSNFETSYAWRHERYIRCYPSGPNGPSCANVTDLTVDCTAALPSDHTDHIRSITLKTISNSTMFHSLSLNVVENIRVEDTDATSIVTRPSLPRLIELVLDNVAFFGGGAVGNITVCGPKTTYISIVNTPITTVGTSTFAQCTELRGLTLRSNKLQAFSLGTHAGLSFVDLNGNVGLQSVTMPARQSVRCHIEGAALALAYECRAPPTGTRWLQSRVLSVVMPGDTDDDSDTELALEFGLGLVIVVIVVVAAALVVFHYSNGVGVHLGWERVSQSLDMGF